MFTLKNKLLKVDLPNGIKSNIVSSFKLFDSEDIELILMDFDNVNYVSLSGLMYLVIYCARMTNKNESRANNSTKLEIINIESGLKKILMNFGFFSPLDAKANLSNINRGVNYGKILREEFDIIRNRKNFAKTRNNTGDNVLMPIFLIPRGEEKYFESFFGSNKNNFVNFYENLSSNSSLNFFRISDEKEIQNSDYAILESSITEIMKNIYDHSESWGVGGIHATPKIGTQISFYDLGIGIASSVRKRSPQKINPIDAIKLAFQDGYTTKPKTNFGRGFTVMKKIVEKKGGKLFVRSGEILAKNSQNGFKFSRVNFFPGTQIILHIPSKDQLK